MRRKAPVWDCYCRDVRLRFGLALEDVARQVGVSARGLLYIEAGHNPGLLTATRLATFYGKPLEDLWRRME